MYDNINPYECITRLRVYLFDAKLRKRFKHYSPDALINAIKLVMFNNRMRFGDLLVKQLVGVTMGMSPAPSLANLFVALHETSHILNFLETFLFYLKRFIDDGFGIWLHDADPMIDENNWRTFQQAVNSGGLSWEFSKRAKSVVFMDMTIEIEEGKIMTKLYAKPLALYLYIPPHSAHAPGVHTGLVFGNVLQIFQLNSRESDIINDLRLFYNCLVDQGHQPKDLIPRFTKAIENAERYLSLSEEQRSYLKEEKKNASKRQVYFHLPYHPNNPSSSQIQKLWRDIVATPVGKKPLKHFWNSCNARIPIDRMIVCFSRAPNLGNQLSYRKIGNRQGPKVSSFI